MDPLMGAAIAGAAAAVSIVAAAFLPMRLLDGRVLRLAGAASIAAMGLVAFGVPIPALVPLCVLVAGFVVAFAMPLVVPRLTGRGDSPATGTQKP